MSDAANTDAEPSRVVIDCAGEGGPIETREPLTEEELVAASQSELAAVAAEREADRAANDRAELVAALRAGTATQAQVQAALAAVLDPK